MNIAMLIPGVHSPGLNGTYRDAGEVQSHQLAIALGSLGHRVIIYTRRCGPEDVQRLRTGLGPAISALPAGPPVALNNVDVCQHLGEFADMLAGAWRGEPPDVLHAHAWVYGLAALLAGRRHRGLPVVQTFHGLGVDGPWSRPTVSLAGHRCGHVERTIAGKADAVIAHSATDLSDLVRLGVPRSRISVIPYGVDVQRMSPDGSALFHSVRYRLVVLDPLAVQHGVDDVVSALSALPDTELIVTGGPPAAALAGDGDARRIRDLAHRVGVADRVTLLGGIPSDQVPPLLRSSDAVVSVPWSHSTGKLALDAMGCGLPVLCADVGGLADAVVDGVTGLHVPARRPDQLARVARVLLREPCRRTGLGLAGRDRVLARYGWRRVATETVQLYERLLHSPATLCGRTAHGARRAASTTAGGRRRH
ncbi:glycosyltransferase [Pseudonocardia sp. Cha107L01]|uniref:glycosyltransferase n=1 Tax=Pseudonocardia sp. Cha107L01 TaxID=3457576 RepID=UPI00403E7D5C